MYIESEAEEIYLPDGHYRSGKMGNWSKRVSTTTEDDSGILGY